MTEQTDKCKNCVHCTKSYQSGYCRLKEKNVSYNGICNQYRRKEG